MLPSCPGRLYPEPSLLVLYPLFITMTGGKDASDKYHKQGEKLP
jgi:hypothetical protein